jgi:chromate transporter
LDREGEAGVIYFQLFLSFLSVGAFSFGGGYASLALIRQAVVLERGWLTAAEFANLITISEMTPGPIAINAATFVGTRIAGLPGALVATLGCVLPPCLIVALLSHLYLRYRKQRMIAGVLDALRPTVVSLVASAGLSILVPMALAGGAVQWQPILLFLGCLALLQWKKIRPIGVMLLAGAMGLLVDFLRGAL